jgi:glycosyltransferase involved in cell wall biosynthesis
MSAPTQASPIRALMELRPALSGHAGIPQETRLLFRSLLDLPDLEFSGLIQSSNHLLAPGTPSPGSAELERLAVEQRIERLSRVVISSQAQDGAGLVLRALDQLRLMGAAAASMMGAALGNSHRLGHFEPAHFKDFIWRGLFSKTLPAEDFDAITSARYRVARLPWSWAHLPGMLSTRSGGRLYPRLDTSDFDLFIGETPYPGRVSPNTRMVIRYHDAIPLLMPHTISDKRYHHASHAAALRQNVADGAWFSCVSEATRSDLLTVYPQLESRSVVIPNMVSHHYHAEPVDGARVPGILHNRQSPAFPSRTQGESTATLVLRPGVEEGSCPLQYLLMVSTIEPRKNHLTLLAAWEQLRSTTHPDLELVLVGNLGWEHGAIKQKLQPWIGRGLHMLEDVPASELRVLYQHARVTVCPSFGEGFDFSGVEAMQSGGVVAASDIPVHREVYGEASRYFSAYAAADARRCLLEMLGLEPAERAAMAAQGATRCERYSMPALLPAWNELLCKIAAN